MLNTVHVVLGKAGRGGYMQSTVCTVFSNFVRCKVSGI